MTPPSSLFRSLLRNLRWYGQDLVTGITAKGTLHFTYDDAVSHRDADNRPTVNPATGLPMTGRYVDGMGNPFGVDLRQ